MPSVTFTCKDRTLARYCELEFGKRFQADLDATPPEKRSELLGRWKEILYSEAMRQEWYDYILDDQGKRHPIYEPVRRPPQLGRRGSSPGPQAGAQVGAQTPPTRSEGKFSRSPSRCPSW